MRRAGRSRASGVGDIRQWPRRWRARSRPPTSRCSTSAWRGGGTTCVDGLAGAYEPDCRRRPRRAPGGAGGRGVRRAQTPELKRLDLRRLLEPDWFQHPRMLGYAAYADRFAGDLRRRRRARAVPRRARRHLPPPDAAAAAAAGSERRRVRRRRLPDRAPRPRHGRRPARPGHAAAGRRASACASTSCSTTSPASTRGPRRPGPATRRTGGSSTSIPDRTVPDAYERDAARGLPRLRARQLHVGRRRRRLGVDDVQLVAVGPRLVEPRRRLRVRRHHPVPRQPRRRGHPPRRHRLHLEAPRHDVPEPARGPRHHPGAAGGHPDGRAGRGVQGRGDRRAGRRRPLPRSGRPPRQGQRPRLPQQPDGADLVDAGHAATCGCRCTCCGRSARSRRRRRGSRTSAATTTSGGPSTTPTPPPSACPAPAHRAFLSDYYSGDFWQSPARGVVFQHNEVDRRSSHQRDAGQPGRARRRAREQAATTHRRPSTWRSTASC